MNRLRTAIKRVVIAGYCRHWIPAWAASVAFWAFRLQRL